MAITEKLPALQTMLKRSGIEAELRQMMGAEGSTNFSLSLSPTNASFSFSVSGSNGESESYTRSVPYQAPEIPADNPSV